MERLKALYHFFEAGEPLEGSAASSRVLDPLEREARSK